MDDEQAMSVLVRIARLLDAGLTARQIGPSIRQLERIIRQGQERGNELTPDAVDQRGN
jgi:hypothetical protein